LLAIKTDSEAHRSVFAGVRTEQYSPGGKDEGLLREIVERSGLFEVACIDRHDGFGAGVSFWPDGGWHVAGGGAIKFVEEERGIWGGLDGLKPLGPERLASDVVGDPW
jgi:hypothetical protein